MQKCTPCMEYNTPRSIGVLEYSAPRDLMEYGVLASAGGMGVLEYGVLEYWSIGVLEYWSMEYWSIGVWSMEY